VLIDGPTTGILRQSISLKNVALTNIVVPLPRGARSKTVQKVIEKEAVADKWSKTSTARKLAQQTIRKNLNDFERFKVMVLKQKVREKNLRLSKRVLELFLSRNALSWPSLLKVFVLCIALSPCS
jgi:ribosomal protein L14E/L6E/L27E